MFQVLAVTLCAAKQRLTVMKWLDRIPFLYLTPLAIFLALAPFSPEPHLWEKLKMLFAGTLVRPVDIFDLFLHGTPLLILLLKLLFTVRGHVGGD
jgi:hypothetical protein